MNQYFINHPLQYMPRAPSFTNLKQNLPSSYSSYHLQQTQQLRPSNIHHPALPANILYYDKTSCIALSGTKHPLYHGRPFISTNQLSPTGRSSQLHLTHSMYVFYYK